MKFTSFTVNPFQENTYLAWKGSDAVVFDPGFATSLEFSAFTTYLKDNSLNLKAILLTHSHIDHVMGLRQTKISFPDIPVFLHKEDLPMWENVGVTASMYGIPFQKFDFEPTWLTTESEIEFGELKFEIRFTPGHAPGHVVFFHSESQTLFAGDTLFEGSIGRTDLPLGNFSHLEESIKNRLYTLPEKTVVLPGHGNSTTIGKEKLSNPFVRG